MKLNIENTPQNDLQSIVHTTHKAVIDSSAANLVMDMLSKLYSKPLAAAVREYVSNSIDAHIKCNVSRPVDVTLPTRLSPRLVVRDYGVGLSVFDIITIYGNFGTSDKRDSDDFIGGFGIGSKSGLAVSDIIDVTSIRNKKKNSFVVKRTPDGIVTQFREEDADATGLESGTTVSVDVNPAQLPLDDDDAKTYYLNVLAGWPVKDVEAHCINPDIASFINEHRIPDTWHEMKNGYITTEKNRKEAGVYSGFLVGNVFYTDLVLKDMIRIVRNAAGDTSRTLEGFENQPMALKLDIADTKVSYSREKVLFDADQKTALCIHDKMIGLVNEIQNAVKQLNPGSMPIRDYVRRLAALGIETRNAYGHYLNILNRYQDATGTVQELRGLSENSDVPLNTNGVVLCLNGGNSSQLSEERTVTSLQPNEYVGRLIITMNAETQKLTVNTLASYVRKVNINKSLPSTPAVQTVANYISKARGWSPYRMRHAFIIPEEALPKLAYIDDCTIVALENVRDEMKEFQAAKRKRVAQATNNFVPSIDCMYVCSPRDPYNATVVRVDYKEWASLEMSILKNNLNAIILEENSKFLFNTKDSKVPNMLGYILHASYVICRSTKRSQQAIVANLPSAHVMTDAEIVSACVDALRPFVWLSASHIEDIAHARSQRINVWDDSDPKNQIRRAVFVMDEAGCMTYDNMKWLPFNARNIKCIHDTICGASGMATRQPLLQPIADLFQNMTVPFPVKDPTYKLRLVISLCNSYTTQLKVDEAKSLIRDALSDYTDEIKALKDLYDAYAV
jgi:hypothetical protein